jgi:hypothetical protein
MDEDRKYKQRGYMDVERDQNGSRGERPRQPGPKLPLDVTGPRLPRMVQSVTASRCFSCSTTLPADTDFRGKCPKCGAALHCCKQCGHFEPSTRFQCLKPIPVRIAVKDAANECEMFKPRVTVAREGASGSSSTMPSNGVAKVPEPRSPGDARAAFDNLFKK